MRPTILKISLNTLVQNAKAVKAILPMNVRMLCVVKADAYGHGALAYAKALHNIADAFAVATVEEGEELRRGGIDEMIVVLGGSNDDSLRRAVRARLSQAVYDIDTLRVLQEEARTCGVVTPAHLKIDTGMSRIGVRNEDELNALLTEWKECDNVRMEGCFTHFCVADSDEAFTAAQNDFFNHMLEIVHSYGFKPIAHAAASTALAKKEYQHDMVRAGIILYGTGVEELNSLVNYAQILVTRPVRIEWIKAGDTVGYGRTFKATKDTRVMTLPIGYGDGYPRALSRKADVLIRGKRAPIIGNVCMDMIMVDITYVPEAQMGDEVVLMGAQGDERITPDELAKLANTIPYEIMLGFHSRVPRIIMD